MDTVERLRILRDYESFCYRVCFYLLENERLAAASAQQAMLELYADAAFFRSPNGEKANIIRKIAAKHALKMFGERHGRRGSPNTRESFS